MKSLIVYSSKSGNTKKLVETIRYILPGEKVFKTMEENPENLLKDHSVEAIFPQGLPQPWRTARTIMGCFHFLGNSIQHRISFCK